MAEGRGAAVLFWGDLDRSDLFSDGTRADATRLALQPKDTGLGVPRPVPPAIQSRALLLACERIADGPQEYHEANTPEGWAEVFMEAARDGKTTDEVLASRPAPRMMTDEERLVVHLDIDSSNASLIA